MVLIKLKEHLKNQITLTNFLNVIYKVIEYEKECKWYGVDACDDSDGVDGVDGVAGVAGVNVVDGERKVEVM